MLSTHLLFLATTLLTSLFHPIAAHVAKRSGSLQQITDFGDNPTGVGMYIYVPNNLASNPGIVVAIHYCTSPYFSTLSTTRRADNNTK